jgi:hypothetical protein
MSRLPDTGIAPKIASRIAEPGARAISTFFDLTGKVALVITAAGARVLAAANARA